MPRAALLCAILIGHSALARADEPARRGGPTPTATDGDGVTSEVAATASLARGVTDRTLVTARGIVAAEYDGWGGFVQPSWVFGQVNGKRSDNELFVRVLGFHAFADRWFAFAVGVGEHSLHRKIDERAFGGAGVGITALREPAARLLVSVGVVDEVTWFASPLLADGTVLANDRRQTVRAVARLYGRYVLPGAGVVLTHDLYVMPSVSARSDLRAIAYVALDVPIHGGLAGRVVVDASYEQRIVEGTEHDDLAVTFGLSYAFRSRREAD